MLIRQIAMKITINKTITEDISSVADDFLPYNRLFYDDNTLITLYQTNRYII